MSVSIEKLDAMVQAIYEYPRTEPEVYMPKGWEGMLKLKHQHLLDYEKARASKSRIRFHIDGILGANELTLAHPDGTVEDVSHWLWAPRPWAVQRAEMEHIAAKYVQP